MPSCWSGLLGGHFVRSFRRSEIPTEIKLKRGNSYALFQEPCPACCCCSRCFVAASAANAAAVDVAGVVTDIGAQAAPIGLIGAAVLLIYVGVKAFKWVRAALS